MKQQVSDHIDQARNRLDHIRAGLRDDVVRLLLDQAINELRDAVRDLDRDAADQGDHERAVAAQLDQLRAMAAAGQRLPHHVPMRRFR